MYTVEMRAWTKVKHCIATMACFVYMKYGLVSRVMCSRFYHIRLDYLPFRLSKQGSMNMVTKIIELDIELERNHIIRQRMIWIYSVVMLLSAIYLYNNGLKDSMIHSHDSWIVSLIVSIERRCHGMCASERLLCWAISFGDVFWL